MSALAKLTGVPAGTYSVLVPAAAPKDSRRWKRRPRGVCSPTCGGLRSRDRGFIDGRSAWISDFRGLQLGIRGLKKRPTGIRQPFKMQRRPDVVAFGESFGITSPALPRHTA